MNDHNLSVILSWIEKADHDLGSAKIIFLHIPEYVDTIAFHCQQAVEKYIKAALIYFEIDFKKTHDLPYLLDLLSCKTQIDTEAYEKAILLNGFGVALRYPNEIIPLSEAEIRNAISISEEFRDIMLKKMSIDNDIKTG